MSETKIPDSYHLVEIPDLNRFRIGDRVRVTHPDFEAEWRQSECIVIGIELRKQHSRGLIFEADITILHDGDQVSDGWKPVDLTPAPKESRP
jgi:hypothetical protein